MLECGVSDVLRLKWSDFKDGRLYYKMGKNQKVLSLIVPEKAANILAHYENDKISNDDYIFPGVKKVNLESERVTSTFCGLGILESILLLA